MIDGSAVVRALSSTEPITSYVDLDSRAYRQNLRFPGLYVFWFDNSDGVARDLHREVTIDGPDRAELRLVWDWNLSEKLICLYVGKSTNLQKRLGLHLLLKTGNLYSEKSIRLLKKTTSCQLRSGFDFLFQLRSGVDITKELAHRLRYSYFAEDSFVKRFYIEDFLVGRLLPWFNVDSES